jgi:hypothetical protein
MCYFLNGGNMRKAKTLKYGILISLILLASLTSVMYALAYTVKREVLYTQTFKIDGQKQMFRAFYLSAPAVLFEVKLSVSKGTIKWTPYSAVLFEATFDSFQSRINEATIGTFQGWECETDAGTVKWRIDPENLNQVWYLSFLNEDQYEKEVTVEVTKVRSEQNIQDWM